MHVYFPVFFYSPFIKKHLEEREAEWCWKARGESKYSRWQNCGEERK